VTYVPRDTGHGAAFTECSYSRHIANTSLKVHYSFHKSLNSVQTATYALNVHFNIILSSMPLLQERRLFCSHFEDKHLNSSPDHPYVLHTRPIQTSSIYPDKQYSVNSTNINLLTVQLVPSFCHCLSRSSTYSSTLLSDTLWLSSYLNVADQLHIRANQLALCLVSLNRDPV
jgi:hypothetical protein